jgi:hypothetical protein
MPHEQTSLISGSRVIDGAIEFGIGKGKAPPPAAPVVTKTLAKREGCSIRKVNMTISLAFLAPDLVKAAIDGRLPHGMGVARLADLPHGPSSTRCLAFPPINSRFEPGVFANPSLRLPGNGFLRFWGAFMAVKYGSPFDHLVFCAGESLTYGRADRSP